MIQKRHDGSQSFNQPWESYKRGFGSLSGEKNLRNRDNIGDLPPEATINAGIFSLQASSGWAWRRSIRSPNKVLNSCGWSSVMEQDSSSQWPNMDSAWTERRRGSPSTWRTRPRRLPPPRAAPEFPFPRRTETTTWTRTSTARSCFQVRLRPPSTPERHVSGRRDSDVWCGLQAVGGSAAAATGTRTADTPEG